MKKWDIISESAEMIWRTMQESCKSVSINRKIWRFKEIERKTDSYRGNKLDKDPERWKDEALKKMKGHVQTGLLTLFTYSWTFE